MIEISSDRLSLVVDPAHGGVIRRFAIHQGGSDVDLLRPAVANSTDPLDSCCFPLVPFSNRIGLGQFEWNGRKIQLPSNFEGGHAIHGHGWQRAWVVSSQDASTAIIGYDHAADAWPFAYSAELKFLLSDTNLTVELSVQNQSDETMPAGLGFHPYFRRPKLGGLETDVSGVWINGDDMLPTSHIAGNIPRDIIGKWLPPGATFLDHCFTGWSGAATIEVPDWDHRLVLQGGNHQRFLVVYAPPESDYFCVEPVSNINNAVNQPKDIDTGLVALAPGASLMASLILQIEG